MKTLLSAALILVLGPVTGCVSGTHALVLDPVGPPVLQAISSEPKGSLVVYSALDSQAHFNSLPHADFYTDYKVLSPEGRLVESVSNNPSPSVPGPRQVELGPGGMGTNMMARRKQMMEEHQKMMAEMKAMDADLDKKVAQMNQAQGNAKVDAMAAVVNDLVKERQMMHRRMSEMQQRMMAPMRPMPGGMGGAARGMSSGNSESGSQPGRE